MFFKKKNDNNIDNNDKNAIDIKNVENNNNNNKENTKPSASSNDDSYSNVDWDKVGEVFENSNWTQIGSGYIDGPNGNTWEKYEGAYDGDIKSENIYGK